MVEPANAADDITRKRAASKQVTLERRKKRAQPAQTAREEPVAMPSLRDAVPILHRRGQVVAVEHGDTIEMRTEHTRGKQPPDARADDNGVVAAEAPRGRSEIHGCSLRQATP